MKNGNAFRNMVFISQLAINILVPAFLLLALGLWIDSKAGTSYWAVILLIIGILGGAKSAYTIAMNAVRADETREEKPEDIVDRYNKEHGGGSK